METTLETSSRLAVELSTAVRDLEQDLDDLALRGWVPAKRVKDLRKKVKLALAKADERGAFDAQFYGYRQ